MAPPPAPVVGATSRNVLPIVYVKPAMVVDVGLNVIEPVLWFVAIAPVSVPNNVEPPAIGAVCVIVIVSVPLIPEPVPVALARISPKLILEGVLTVPEAEPLKVRVAVFPPEPKTTKLLPLPVHVTQVNTPEVLNVTLSARAADAATAIKPVTSAAIREVLKRFFM